MEAETGRGVGVFILRPKPRRPLAHCLSRTPVVRHYKVKREGSTYVIDVEEPVSDGPEPREYTGGICAPLLQQP